METLSEYDQKLVSLTEQLNRLIECHKNISENIKHNISLLVNVDTPTDADEIINAVIGIRRSVLNLRTAEKEIRGVSNKLVLLEIPMPVFPEEDRSQYLGYCCPSCGRRYQRNKR